MHELVGRVLCGRMPGVGLGEEGRRQATALAERLAPEGLAAIHSSPAQRARETAEVIALRLGLAVTPCPELDEIEFGAWTGRSFASLAGDPGWERWNTQRGTARPPGGETMAEAQQRAMRWLEEVRLRHPGAAVAAVSHGDVIKAVLAGCLG